MALRTLGAAIVCACPVVLLQGCGSSASPEPQLFAVEFFDDAGKLVIDATPAYTLVGDNFNFIDGLAWSKEQGTWYFSDIPGNTMYQYKDGTLSEFRKPSNKSNGLAIDNAGMLLSCEHVTRAVVSTNLTSGVRTILVDEFEGKKLNSPNDIIVSKSGVIYFTDPDYGATPDFGYGGPIEQPYNNVFRYDPSNEQLTSVLQTFMRPNGLALNGDETKMYVADTGAAYEGYNASNPHMVGEFTVDVSSPGSLTDEKTFLTVAVNNGVSDGLKVDEKGNVWSTAADGVYVSDSSGKLIAKIPTETTAVNLFFGGPDGKDLLLVAATHVWILKTLVTDARNADASSVFQF